MGSTGCEPGIISLRWAATSSGPPQFAWSEVISIDECGFSESQLPLYGYAKAGTRVVVRGPGGWKHKSLLMAVSSTGRYWFAVFDGAVKGAMLGQMSPCSPALCSEYPVEEVV
jgi:hypothetical protein